MPAPLGTARARSLIVAALACMLLGASAQPVPDVAALLANAARIDAARESPPPFSTYVLDKELRANGAVLESRHDHVWRRTSDGRARIYDESTQTNRFGVPEATDPLARIATLPGPNPAPVTADAYDVTLAGTENVGGRDAYHLLLHAKPGGSEKRPLTDAFIDVADGCLTEIRFPGVIPLTISGKPARTVRIPVVYDVVAEPNHGRWTLARFGFSGAADGNSLTLSYRFSDVATPASIPDWYFDERAFNAHA